MPSPPRDSAQVCRWPVSYSSDLPIFAARMLPYATFLHLIFALWSYSMIAVPQSVIVGDSLMSILNGLTNALRKVWENTNQLTPVQVWLLAVHSPLVYYVSVLSKPTAFSVTLFPSFFVLLYSL